jgi:hypothetical protein
MDTYETLFNIKGSQIQYKYLSKHRIFLNQRSSLCENIMGAREGELRANLMKVTRLLFTSSLSSFRKSRGVSPF